MKEKIRRFFGVMAEETRSFRDLAVLSIAFKRLWTKASKRSVILAVIFSALEAMLYAVNPIILRYLIDVLGRGYNVGWDKPLLHAIPFLPAATCQSAAVWLTAIMIGFSVLWYGAFNTSTGFARNTTYYSQVTFATETFAHILNLSMDFHVKSRKGEVLQKTEKAITDSQDFLYNAVFMNFLRAGLSIVLVLAVIYGIDWRLFVICAAVLGLGMYTNIVFGSRVSKEEKAAWKNVSEVQARSLDVMQNIRETKIFGNEPFEIERRQREAEEQLVPLRNITMLWRKLTTIENLWQNLGFAIAMFTIILPGVFRRRFTIGQVAQFTGSYLMLFGFFMQVFFKYLDAQKLQPKLRDLKKLYDTKSLVVDGPSAVPFRGFRDKIDFRSVNFTYPGQERKQALCNVGFAIPKGRVTVLVGKTGSGKSTLANLLMRLYDPTEGAVLADGVDIRTFEQNSFRRAFTVLSQQAYLFNASIAYNIAYSRVGAPLEDIMWAARIAQAHDFIEGLPDGYGTIVAEGAANISGGQQKRIALARAVLARDAEIVVLDEPTTGLDEQTANSFLDELVRVFHGKTIVMITHDDAVMRRADQVIRVEDGGVVQVQHAAH